MTTGVDKSQSETVEANIARLSSAQRSALVQLEAKWWKTDATEAAIEALKNYERMIAKWAELGRNAVKSRVSPEDGWAHWVQLGNQMLETISEHVGNAGYTPLDAVREAVEVPVKKVVKKAKQAAHAAAAAGAEVADTYKTVTVGAAVGLGSLALLYALYLFKGR